MKRAAVLIGVSQSGGLPRLQAVEAGISGMRNWANSQGIDDVVLLTDKGGSGEVLASSIFTEIEKLVDKAVYEHLFIYYAGHGINNGYSEYWLLSNAPQNANEAINVAGSTVLAERSGIPHVVIMSDACRTAPDSINAQSVTGYEIFPNLAPSGSAASVDVFYACLLGEPANEFNDADDSSNVFRSLYTEVFLEALNGEYPELTEPATQEGTDYDVVRPWPLKRQLPPLVTGRIRKENLWRKLSQTPDAKVTSDPKIAWISRHELQGRSRMRSGRPPADDQDLREVAVEAVNRAVDPGSSRAGVFRSVRPRARVEGEDSFDNATEGLVPEFGPRHFETGAGFKIRGSRFEEAFAIGAETQPGDEVLRVAMESDRRAVNVLVRFESGTCAVLPALHQFMAAVTVESGRLIDVSYEPMDTSNKWDEFQYRAADIRAARATVAAASRMGLLRLDPETALATARHFQSLKGLDPSFALYAAYAYHDLGRRDLIKEMRDFQMSDLTLSFFDLDMLAGTTPMTGSGPERATSHPFFPMFSQGWSLIRAFGVTVPDAVAEAAQRLPSLWTMFRPEAYERIKQDMAGEGR